MANGPLMIVPGSHRGPIHDHHADGIFCGAMDPANHDVDYNTAIPLTGRAGSITVHHVRAIHGSAPNVSDNDRRLLLFQFRTADAWPRSAPASKFKELMVCGFIASRGWNPAVPRCRRRNCKARSTSRR
jgi:ectoine hydroxylase-related dioxygenase (phytanoyl-CoA dioxygenase family)